MWTLSSPHRQCCLCGSSAAPALPLSSPQASAWALQHDPSCRQDFRLSYTAHRSRLVLHFPAMTVESALFPEGLGSFCGRVVFGTRVWALGELILLGCLASSHPATGVPPGTCASPHAHTRQCWPRFCPSVTVLKTVGLSSPQLESSLSARPCLVPFVRRPLLIPGLCSLPVNRQGLRRAEPREETLWPG